MIDIIKGKSIWLTGASSGIGYALAKLLIENNNFVVVSARTQAKLEPLKTLGGDRVSIVTMDVADSESMKSAADRIGQHTDHLDMVIVCAGTCEYDDGPDLNIDMYRRVMQTNYFGAVETIHTALPFLKRSEQKAQIIGVSSLTTVAPFPRAEAYGASKAALEYFLLSLKVDLTPQGIDVFVVRPGFVDTPLTQKNDFEMPFLINSEQAAKAIVDGIAKGKTMIDFPKRMSYLLRTLNYCSSFWFKVVAPKLRKSDTL